MIVIRLRCFWPTYLSQPSLICDFCSLDQSFAYSFLQILPHNRHPCCSTIHFPLSWHVRDLHPLERAHGAQTKKSRPKAAQLCRKLALLLHLSETLAAINRSVLSWLERNNSLAAARSTSCCISLSFRLCSSLSCISASFTSLWLIYETFLSIELLLSCCETNSFPHSLHTNVLSSYMVLTSLHKIVPSRICTDTFE